MTPSKVFWRTAEMAYVSKDTEIFIDKSEVLPLAIHLHERYNHFGLVPGEPRLITDIIDDINNGRTSLFGKTIRVRPCE